jgi:putative ABC transport system permease protein
MSLRTRLASMVGWAWHRDRVERDLDAELRAYVELSTADKVRDGLSPAEARRQALIELGGIEPVKEQVRTRRHGGALDELWRDVRYGIRLFAKTPLFSAVIVMTLALGIGANTAIFSVIDALMLRWLPVRAPQELVQVVLRAPGAPEEGLGGTVSYPIVKMLEAQRDTFAGAGGYSSFQFDVGDPGTVVRVQAAVVTGGFFDTLGLQAQAGRLIGPADDAPGAPPVAVISDGYWLRQFGRRADAIGSTLPLNGVAVPIVGVTPRGFVGATVGLVANITVAAATIPVVSPASAPLLEKGNFWLTALGRPQAGATKAQTIARLNAAWRHEAPALIAPHWPATQRAEVAAMEMRLRPGGNGWSFLREMYRRPLQVLMAVVGVVLLITCANVASLLLARATSRRHEMALRLALGASRGRVVRQLLIEGLVLALAGAILAVALASAASRGLVAIMATPGLTIDIDLAPNPRILAFTTIVAVATAILFAVVPALQATATGPAQALASGPRATRQRSRWLPVLVSGQMALAFLLLAGAGLFLRTLHNLQRVDTGFDSDGVVLVPLDPDRIGARDVAGEVAALPGVIRAAVATHTPLSGAFWSEPFVPAGQPIPDKDTALAIGAGPGYFETLGIRIVAGRPFEAGDTAGSLPVAVVSESFARRVFPGRPAVGQSLDTRMRRTVRRLTIVGVAEDTRLGGLRQEPPQTVYLVYSQLLDEWRMNLLVRGTGGPGAVAKTIEPVVRAAMPGAAYEPEALAAQVGGTLVRERVLALLATGFGLLAVLLAAIGLYGLVAYGVTQRTREFGVRLALGARRREILALVVSGSAWLVAAGALMGVPAAWLTSRWLRALLYGVEPGDPATVAGAVGILVVTALIAAWLPARRAAGTDPVVALRQE